MTRLAALLLCCCVQLVAGAGVYVGDVVPHIAAGGSWRTELQIMHSNWRDVPERFTASFYGQDGKPLTLRVDELNADVAEVSEMLQPRGVRFLTLTGGAEVKVGYVVVNATTPRAATVTAIVTQTIPDRPDFQAAFVSLDQLGTNFQLPFRNDGPYTTTVAFVSLAEQDVLLIARAENGAELCRVTLQAGGMTQQALIVREALLCSDDRRGVLEIVPAPDKAVAPVAFLFNDTGAFLIQQPLEIVPSGVPMPLREGL